MLTFLGHFTVCINFIEPVGFEVIHEKQLQGQRRTKTMGYCPFRLLCHDREFWFSVVIESLCRDRDFGLPVAIESLGHERAARVAVRA